jgi:hypothetical protein
MEAEVGNRERYEPILAQAARLERLPGRAGSPYLNIPNEKPAKEASVTSLGIRHPQSCRTRHLPSCRV